MLMKKIKSFFLRKFITNKASDANNYRRAKQAKWDDVCM